MTFHWFLWVKWWLRTTQEGSHLSDRPFLQIILDCGAGQSVSPYRSRDHSLRKWVHHGKALLVGSHYIERVLKMFYFSRTYLPYIKWGIWPSVSDCIHHWCIVEFSFSQIWEVSTHGDTGTEGRGWGWGKKPRTTGDYKMNIKQGFEDTQALAGDMTWDWGMWSPGWQFFWKTIFHWMTSLGPHQNPLTFSL
jgi:hypothetical protein